MLRKLFSEETWKIISEKNNYSRKKKNKPRIQERTNAISRIHFGEIFRKNISFATYTKPKYNKQQAAVAV